MNFSVEPGEVTGHDQSKGLVYVALVTDGGASRKMGRPCIVGNALQGIQWLPKQGDWVLVSILPGGARTILCPWSDPKLVGASALTPGDVRASGHLGIGRLSVYGTGAAISVAAGACASSAILLSGANDTSGLLQWVGTGVAGIVATLTVGTAAPAKLSALLMPQGGGTAALFPYAPDGTTTQVAVVTTSGGTNGSTYTLRYHLVCLP